jgi:hypothetical protein
MAKIEIDENGFKSINCGTLGYDTDKECKQCEIYKYAVNKIGRVNDSSDPVTEAVDKLKLKFGKETYCYKLYDYMMKEKLKLWKKIND